IRKQFSEPRIHFAVNCASASCPDLRNEAYTGSQLNRQLDEQARRFINDPRKNKISPSGTQLSKIFSWFQGDFTKKGYTIVEFVNKYAKVKISDKTKISYLDYLWTLNE
ncbi:MAG: DUF547 domain-containing protein, partial [Flavobacteriales bacterium]